MRRSIDYENLHEMFMAGKKLSDIAREMGRTEANIKKAISLQRKRSPEKWPLRVPRDVPIDIDRLHRLYMTGEKLGNIARELKTTAKRCRITITRQRKIDPNKWPRRTEKPHLEMQVFYCDECCSLFTVDMAAEVEDLVCPSCLGDSHQNLGTTYLSETKRIEKVLQAG